MYHVEVLTYTYDTILSRAFTVNLGFYQRCLINKVRYVHVKYFLVISTVSLQSTLTYEMIVFTLCQLLPNFCNVYPNIGFTKKSLFFKTLYYIFSIN